MDICIINGKKYNVLVTAIEEYFNILDSENAGRVIARGRMILDRIGTAIGHNVTFERKHGEIDEFDDLFNYLLTPRNNGIQVQLAHGQSVIQYEAYVSSGKRSIKRVQDGKIYWDKLSVNFIPMETQEVI